MRGELARNESAFLNIEMFLRKFWQLDRQAALRLRILKVSAGESLETRGDSLEQFLAHPESRRNLLHRLARWLTYMPAS